MEQNFLGVAPWVLITGAVTWLGQAFLYRKDLKKIDLDHTATIGAQRDELAIELLANARSEVIAARSEMQGLREEVSSLRGLERHFYHFQQALDHLSAVLFAETEPEKQAAERNAKAFLTRMKVLKDAANSKAQMEKRA